LSFDVALQFHRILLLLIVTRGYGYERDADTTA
jgi:hypothetical protein